MKNKRSYYLMFVLWFWAGVTAAPMFALSNSTALAQETSVCGAKGTIGFFLENHVQNAQDKAEVAFGYEESAATYSSGRNYALTLASSSWGEAARLLEHFVDCNRENLEDSADSITDEQQDFLLKVLRMSYCIDRKTVYRGGDSCQASSYRRNVDFPPVSRTASYASPSSLEWIARLLCQGSAYDPFTRDIMGGCGTGPSKGMPSVIPEILKGTDLADVLSGYANSIDYSGANDPASGYVQPAVEATPGYSLTVGD